MDSLNWVQDADGLHVTAVSPDGANGIFTVRNCFIKYLLAATPRIFFVFLKFHNQGDEMAYLLDLSSIKPVISKSNALKITIGKKNQDSVAYHGKSVGRYCIARGESYHERFLNDSGWQSQRVYSDIYESSTASKSEVSETPVCQADAEPSIQTVKDTPKPKGKLKICDFCGEIYPSALEICPFCSNKGKPQPKTADNGGDDDVDLDLSL